MANYNRNWKYKVKRYIANLTEGDQALLKVWEDREGVAGRLCKT